MELILKISSSFAPPFFRYVSRHFPACADECRPAKNGLSGEKIPQKAKKPVFEKSSVILSVRFIFILIIFTFSFFQSKAQSYTGWTYVGPKQIKDQVKGFVQALWCDENDLNFVLAGSACGGLFKTETALSEQPKWTNITDSYQSMMTYGVTDIVVKPNTARNEIFISTGSRNGLSVGYGNGILKTTDGGKNWLHVGPGSASDFTLCMDGLVMNRDNGDEMLAWTKQTVYLTKDSWKTWEILELPLDKNNNDLSVADIEYAPFEPGKFYIGTRSYNTRTAKILLCENFGKAVSDITPKDISSERMEIATIYDQRYKGKFYLALGSNNVFLKYFNGKEFSAALNSPLSHLFASAFWCFEMAVNQKDTSIIYLAMTEMSRSKDGGKTFEKMSYYNGVNTHADNRSMLLAKSSVKGEQDVLLLGNDGGLSGSKDGSMKAFRNLNGEGLDNNLFWGVSVAQSDTMFVCGGAADNGGFMITEADVANTMQGCGDGYAGQALDAHSCLIECNPPTMFYHNLKSGKSFYIYVPDDRCENKRPLVLRDSMVYTGYSNVWKISAKQLAKGANRMERAAEVQQVKYGELIKNNTVRALAISKYHSAVVSYRHPNWYDKMNDGKLFFTSDVNAGKWTDITALANYQGKFEVCRWTEIYSIAMDAKDADKFYFVTRDVYNQMGKSVFMMKYFPDSNKCEMKDLSKNLPAIGVSELKLDEFSNILYAAADDGVWWMDLNLDSLNWNQVPNPENKFPNAMVFDIDFNFMTNELYAGTFGRGIWKTRMVSSGKNETRVNKNKSQGSLLKIDGTLKIGRRVIYRVNDRMIVTKNSRIEMKKGSEIIIRNRNLIRNENNEVVDISTFLPKKSPGKVVYLH